MKASPEISERASPAALYDLGRYRVEPADCDLFERMLRDFVPADVFDAHAHLYDLRMLVPEAGHDAFSGPLEVGCRTFHRYQSSWMGERHPRNGLFFAMPARRLDCDAANRFLLDQLQRHPGSLGLLLIRPTDDPAAVEAELDLHQRIRGFKVYHVFADRHDTFNAQPAEFIPRWAWELADARGLCIMLHLVLPRALADERNQEYIQQFCRRYRNARLVLAHAARGFCGRHTVEGISSIRGLDNVFFDTSAVCDASALEAVLDTFGASRLMFGSDFPISEVRGRPVGVGDGFCWIYEDSLDWNNLHLGQLTLCGIESLLALRQACRTRRVRDPEIGAIFSGNARAMLNCQLSAAVDAPFNALATAGIHRTGENGDGR